MTELTSVLPCIMVHCFNFFGAAVSLNGQNSSSSVILHRLCGAGKFGLPGELCVNCPAVG